MMINAFSFLVLLFPFVLASPTVLLKRADLHTQNGGGGENIRDIRILNLALTLEHLASSFYQTYLPKFSEQDFVHHDYAPWVRGRYDQIAQHTQTHIDFLENTVSTSGAQAVEKCEYKFPETTLLEFIELSEEIETIIASAHNGALRYLENKGYVAVVGSMFGVESRHAAWISSAARKQNPWNTGFETPITSNQAYTLAHKYITSCPESNLGMLPEGIRTYPTLTFTSKVEAGKRVDLDFDHVRPDPHTATFAAFLIGTGTFVQPIHADNGKRYVTVPEELQNKGAVYVIVIEADFTEAKRTGLVISDENTVAGPALVMFPFDSEGKVEES